MQTAVTPIMWSAGTGSETTRRIAAPLVGGVFTVTLATLIVPPLLFALVCGRRLPRSETYPRPLLDSARETVRDRGVRS